MARGMFVLTLVSVSLWAAVEGQEPPRPKTPPGVGRRVAPFEPAGPGQGPWMRMDTGAVATVFLQLEGIQGESADPGHKDEIAVLSFQTGVTQERVRAAGGAGAGAGKAQLEDLTITKHVDRATPNLFIHAASGQHIPRAVLSVRRPGGPDYLKLHLTDVVITSHKLQNGPANDPRPLEEVSLDYARIEIEYSGVDASGKALPPEKQGWDVRAGKKV